MSYASTQKKITNETESPKTQTPGTSSLGLENRISFQIHKLNVRLQQISSKIFEENGLNVYSSRILVLLLERKEMRVGELVEIMAMPQSTISHQLQRLEKRKIVKRRRSREDNRSVTVVLTPLGLKIAEECNHLSLEVQAGILAGLSKADVDKLSRLLPALYSALESFRYSADPVE